jgi:hypothetical protein
LDGVGTAHSLRAWLREAEVNDFALGDEVLNGSSHVLDRDGGIDAVLVEQVDSVGAEALQHRVDGATYVVGLAVGSASPLPGLRVAVEPEHRGDDHLVTYGLKRFADDAFGLQWPVGFGRVEERHALVNRGADEGDHVGAAADRPVELAGHRLAAQAEARHLQGSQLPSTRDGRRFSHRIVGVAARGLARLCDVQPAARPATTGAAATPAAPIRNRRRSGAGR